MHIFSDGKSASDKVAHGLLLRRWDMNRCQQSRREVLGKLPCIEPVALPFVAWLRRNQGGGYNLADVAPLGNVALEPKATPAGFVADQDLAKQLLQLLKGFPQLG